LLGTSKSIETALVMYNTQNGITIEYALSKDMFVRK
jgi:hypothetical protein